MKKVLAIVLCLALVMTLAACGSKPDAETTPTEQQTKATEAPTATKPVEKETVAATEPTENTSNSKGYITSKEAFISKVETLVDTSLYSESLEDDDDDSLQKFQIYSYELKWENEKEYDLDYSIKLSDGTNFTLPVTVAELEKQGWTLSAYDADRNLSAGYMTWANLKNTSGKELYVGICNLSEETIQLKEGTVNLVSADQYSSNDNFSKRLDEAVDFTVCGSLTNSSTLEDIVKRLGAPSFIAWTVYVDDDGAYEYSKLEVEYVQKSSVYSHIYFTLSGDGNYITDVSYEVDTSA